MYSSVVRSIALSKTLKCERKKKKRASEIHGNVAEHQPWGKAFYQGLSGHETQALSMTACSLSPLCIRANGGRSLWEPELTQWNHIFSPLHLLLAFPWAVPVRTLLKPDIRYHWYVNILLKWCEPDLVPCPSGAAERTLSREGQRRQGHYRVVIWTNER